MPHLRHVEMVQFKNNVLEGSIMENRNYKLAIAICNFDYWRDVRKEYSYSVEVKFITMVSELICSRTSTVFPHYWFSLILITQLETCSWPFKSAGASNDSTINRESGHARTAESIGRLETRNSSNTSKKCVRFKRHSYIQLYIR